MAMVNATNIVVDFPGGTLIPGIFKSQPVVGYFNTVVGNIYDKKRKALYALVTYQIPDHSQDMHIFLIISRNNGETWSNPIDISTTNFANRGFASMALDPATGNLVFGFYDGRNDPTFKSVEYFGAVLLADKLDELVHAIPLSNPTYEIQPATTPPVANTAGIKPGLREARKAMMKKRFEGRFGDRLSMKSTKK